MKREPLKIGERVRVKDIDQSDGRLCKDSGTVIGVSSDGVQVECDHWSNGDDGGYWFLPRQCVRLRRRERSEKRERLVRWLYMDNYAKEKLCNTRGECESLGKRTDANVAYVRLVELRPGEVVLSRAELAKAWEKGRVQDGKIDFADAERSKHFADMCAALNLPEESK